MIAHAHLDGRSRRPFGSSCFCHGLDWDIAVSLNLWYLEKRPKEGKSSNTSHEMRKVDFRGYKLQLLGVDLFLFAPFYHSYERDQCRTVRLFLSWVSTTQQGTRMKPVRLSCAKYLTQIMCGSQDIGPVYQNMSSMSLFCDPRVANCAACSNVKPYPISQLCGGLCFW